MTRFNNYIKKNLNKIISIFIILSPILDVLVSISINVFHHNINIGIIFRMFFMLFIYYTSVIIYHKKSLANKNLINKKIIKMLILRNKLIIMLI